MFSNSVKLMVAAQTGISSVMGTEKFLASRSETSACALLNSFLESGSAVESRFLLRTIEYLEQVDESISTGKMLATNKEETCYSKRKQSNDGSDSNKEKKNIAGLDPHMGLVLEVGSTTGSSNARPDYVLDVSTRGDVDIILLLGANGCRDPPKSAQHFLSLYLGGLRRCLFPDDFINRKEAMLYRPHIFPLIEDWKNFATENEKKSIGESLNTLDQEVARGRSELNFEQEPFLTFKKWGLKNPKFSSIPKAAADVVKKLTEVEAERDGGWCEVAVNEVAVSPCVPGVKAVYLAHRSAELTYSVLMNPESDFRKLYDEMKVRSGMGDNLGCVVMEEWVELGTTIRSFRAVGSIDELRSKGCWETDVPDVEFDSFKHLGFGASAGLV